MRLAAIAATLVVCTSGCTRARPPVRSSPLVGKAVEVAAKGLDGNEVLVSPPRGARVVVVDFWATWCEPCRDQLAFLGGLAGRYRDQGLAVYAVSFDEDRAAVEEYVATSPLDLPILWDRGGAALAEALDVTRLPTTLVLDGDGVVQAVHLGFDRAEGEKLERDVRRLLRR